MARSDREPQGQADLDLRPIVEAMSRCRMLSMVPNDKRRVELGVERYARLVREAAEDFFDGVVPGHVISGR